MLSYWDANVPDGSLLQNRDGTLGKWVFASGVREIMVGGSSENLPLTEAVALAAQPKAGIEAIAALDVSNSKELTYTVSVSGVYSANMFKIAAKFDQSKLSFVDWSIELPDSLHASALSDGYSINSGTFEATVALMGQGLAFSSENPAPLVKLKFMVKDGVGYGDAVSAELTSLKVISPVGDQSYELGAALDPHSATTNIYSPSQYDIDGDGELSLKDVSQIIYRHYLAKDGGSKWDEARRFDANGDGFIDLSDVIYIMTLI
jgi:hypothetical protein